MSSVIVVNRPIDRIKPHPNADSLELAIVGEWQVVIPKGTYSVGQKVTYVPPDCVLPVGLSDRWGVTKYLSNGRVRAIKLRGEPSYGFIVPAESDSTENLAESLGITKYEIPVNMFNGNSEQSHPLFTQHTDIENLRHFNNIFTEGEEVIVTEKIHGTNSRIGELGENSEWKRVAGSKTMQRKELADSLYWYPWSICEVAAFMEFMKRYAQHQLILCGEIYGKVQRKMPYGHPNGYAYAAFGLKIDEKYVDAEDFYFGDRFKNIPKVPVISVEKFNMESIIEHSKGKSLIPGANHIREGVVVYPVKERTDPAVGRVILKYVSDAYLLGNFDDVPNE